MTDVILAAIILTPVMITFLLKSNAALGFLALCLGFVLSTSVIGDLKNLLSQIDLSLTDTSVAITVLVAPLLLTLLLTHKSAVRGLRFYTQLLIALCSGALLALSLEPILSLQADTIEGPGFWNTLENIQSVIIGTGALLSLLVIWTTGTKHPKKKH